MESSARAVEGHQRDGLRVLIVRIGAMGDVVHGLPAVAALRERLPDCFIGWAVEPRWEELLQIRGTGSDAARGEAKPIVDQIHPVATREWKRKPFAVSTLREILSLRSEMRSARYDVCVDLQGSIRSAAVGRIAGAKRFGGRDAPWEKQARWLYGERVKTEAEHVVDQACEVLGVAVGEKLYAAPVALPRSAAIEQWLDKVLESRAIDAGDRFAVIAPTAGWGAKQWPAEWYNEVAVMLRAARFRVLVNASGPNDAIAKAVARDGAATVVTCTVGQMAALLRRASLTIGGDTGPVHVAAALGRPVLALFGPTDPARTGPYGPRCRVLRHESSQVDHRRHAEAEAGLFRITVDEVAEVALEMLRETANG